MKRRRNERKCLRIGKDEKKVLLLPLLLVWRLLIKPLTARASERVSERERERKNTYADTPKKDKRKKLCRNPVKGLFCAAVAAAAAVAVGCESTLTLK